jgi:hypothetical protein
MYPEVRQNVPGSPAKRTRKSGIAYREVRYAIEQFQHAFVENLVPGGPVAVPGSPVASLVEQACLGSVGEKVATVLRRANY